MPSYQNQNNSSSSSNSTSSGYTQEVDEDQDLIGNAAIQENLTEEQATAQAPSTLNSPYDRVYIQHVLQAQNVDVGLSEGQMRDMQRFKENWLINQYRYQSVSSLTSVPPKLIAALHWRESTGNFNTYLHQGDPLGQPAVNWPNNIPVFHRWEDAAVHALNMKKGIQDQLQMTSDTTSTATIATYAEAYNGLGYHYRNVSSPYVYSGTNQYTSGKYVRDSVFNGSTVDSQLGVVPMVGAIGGLDRELEPKAVDKDFLWTRVVAGQQLLRLENNGPVVEALQERLKELGYSVQVDGDFGPATAEAVRQFQRDHRLADDAVVGSGTATQIEQALRNNQSTSSGGGGSGVTIE